MKIKDQLRELRNLESSPEEEMKRFILSLSRELNLDSGHYLPENVLMSRSFNLSPKQRDALLPAIDALISEGVFEEKIGSIFLTDKGKKILF